MIFSIFKNKNRRRRSSKAVPKMVEDIVLEYKSKGDVQKLIVLFEDNNKKVSFSEADKVKIFVQALNQICEEQTHHNLAEVFSELASHIKISHHPEVKEILDFVAQKIEEVVEESSEGGTLQDEGSESSEGVERPKKKNKKNKS